MIEIFYVRPLQGESKNDFMKENSSENKNQKSQFKIGSSK